VSKLKREIEEKLFILKDNIQKYSEAPYLLHDYKVFQENHVKNAKELFRVLIDIGQEMLNSLDIKDLFVKSKNILNTSPEKINRTNALLNDVQVINYHPLNKEDKYPQEIWSTDRELLDNLINNTNVLLETICDVRNIASEIFKNRMLIFGGAGSGKTNLAVNIVEIFLQNGKPGLLIVASEIKNSVTPIRKQILDLLEITNEYNFSDFLTCLNNLGCMKQTKIPIIIDGLNETQPTAEIWEQELNYLQQDMKNYNYLFLITTCRNSYSEQIFNKKDIQEIKNSYQLNGFDDENIVNAIKKYFKYKRIIIVIGLSSNKDIKGIMRILTEGADKVILVKSSNSRSASPADLKKYSKGRETFFFNSVKEGVSYARNIAYKDDLICVTGSFYVVSDALNIK